MKKLILIFICVMTSIHAQPVQCTFNELFNNYDPKFSQFSCYEYLAYNFTPETIVDSVFMYCSQLQDILSLKRRTDRGIELIARPAEKCNDRKEKVELISKMIDLLNRRPYDWCNAMVFGILQNSILKGHSEDVYEQVLYLCGQYYCMSYCILGGYYRTPEMYNTLLNFYEKNRDTTVFDREELLYTVALARLGHQPSFEIVKRIYENSSPIRHNELAVRMFVAINDRKSLEFLIKLLETDKMYIEAGTLLTHGHRLLISCIKELSPSILGTCWDGVHSKASYAALLECFYATEDKDIIYSNKFIFN
jgi:hypothetical protein